MKKWYWEEKNNNKNSFRIECIYNWIFQVNGSMFKLHSKWYIQIYRGGINKKGRKNNSWNFCFIDWRELLFRSGQELSKRNILSLPRKTEEMGPFYAQLLVSALIFPRLQIYVRFDRVGSISTLPSILFLILFSSIELNNNVCTPECIHGTCVRVGRICVFLDEYLYVCIKAWVYLVLLLLLLLRTSIYHKFISMHTHIHTYQRSTHTHKHTVFSLLL